MHFRTILLLALALLSTPAVAQTTETGAATATGPIQQLRVYEMVDRNKAAFHIRFRDHALRIMRRHGFEVIATWDSTTAEGSEFVYLLQWSDREAMQRGWDAFLADEEWVQIKQHSRETLDGPIMGDIVQDKVLVPTDWSPRKSFQLP